MTDSKDKLYIGVIGAGRCTGKLKRLAAEVGKEIAESGAVLVCGGLNGVMKGAAEGAKSANGTTVGILPGDDRSEANEFIDYAVLTGIGEARNLVVIRTSDALIALPGMFGTLSEIGFALKMKKPVISIGSWDVDKNITQAKNPKEAVALALQAIQK